MKKIKTRVTIKFKGDQSGIQGASFFNADNHDELLEIELPIDDIVRHFNIGTTFAIPNGEYKTSGKFIVRNIFTNIYNTTQGEDNSYSYNFHVVYEVDHAY